MAAGRPSMHAHDKPAQLFKIFVRYNLQTRARFTFFIEVFTLTDAHNRHFTV